jgi:hypothetical protein
LKNHQQQQQQQQQHLMQQQSQHIQIQSHHNHHHQQQQQHHVLPMSLPTQSYLFSRFDDVHSGHVSNPHQQHHVHHQSSEILSNRDPVLTQIILPQQQQQLNLNQKIHDNQASAYNFNTTPNINPSQFINSEYIQPQQQQQQTTEQYFIISNVNSNNNNNIGQMYQNNFSVSLPSNYNSCLMNSKKLHTQQTDNTNFQAHQAGNSSSFIKKEFLENNLNHEASSPSSQSIAASTATNMIDDYDTDKFSKMKLSSPLSIANSQVVSPPGLDAVMTLFDLENLDPTGQSQATATTTSANATTANNMNTLNSLVGDSTSLMLDNYDQLLPIHNSLMNEFENEEKARKDEKARLSPITGEPLEAVTVMGVAVDRCPKPGGIWLDAGELELIIKAATEAKDKGWAESVLGKLIGK